MFTKLKPIFFSFCLAFCPSLAYPQMFDPTGHVLWTQDLQAISTSQAPILYWTAGSGLEPLFGKDTQFLKAEVQEWLKKIDLIWVKNPTQSAPTPSRPGLLELYNAQGQLVKEWRGIIDIDPWLSELQDLLKVDSSPQKGVHKGSLRNFSRLEVGKWKMTGPHPSQLIQIAATKDYAILEDQERGLRFAIPWGGGRLWYCQTRDGIWYPLESLTYVRD